MSSTETTRKVLKGEAREKLVGATIRGMIRLMSPKLREVVEALVDGSKYEISEVSGVLKTQVHDFEKANPGSPAELPEALRAASRGTLSDDDKKMILALRKRGAAYAQLATEFACNQVVIHALFKSKGLTEGRDEKKAEKPKKTPKAKKAPKKATSGRQKKAEPAAKAEDKREW
jgi:hypothetical protein